jgi:hypothetical protein
MTIDIEDIIKIAGLRSAQPAATAVKSGTLYSITDENHNIERSNATAWANFGPQIRAIVKATDETVASSTTLQDDNVLLFAIAASETWAFRFVLHLLSASATPDFKYTIAVPSGATGNFFDMLANTVVAFAATSTVDLAAATAKVLVIEGSVTNGATAGNVKLQWAQNTSDATATAVKAFSNLTAKQQ